MNGHLPARLWHEHAAFLTDLMPFIWHACTPACPCTSTNAATWRVGKAKVQWHPNPRSQDSFAAGLNHQTSKRDKSRLCHKHQPICLPSPWFSKGANVLDVRDLTDTVNAIPSQARTLWQWPISLRQSNWWDKIDHANAELVQRLIHSFCVAQRDLLSNYAPGETPRGPDAIN